MKFKKDNFSAWLHNLYTYEALATVLGNALGKKGAKKLQYPKEPYQLFELTEREKESKAEVERKKIAAYLNQFDIGIAD